MTAQRLSAAVAAVLLSVPVPASVHYSESAAEGLLRLRSDAHEVVFSATNGALLAIRDAAGRSISTGTQGGHLWHADFADGPGIGGGDYGPAGGAGETFLPRWDADRQILLLRYVPAPSSAARVEATAAIGFPRPAVFDLQLRLRNQAGRRLRSVALPHCLAFDADEIEEALLPVLPGIRFNRRFFDERRAWRHGHYPRNTVFADFAWFGIGSGTLGMYSVLREDATPIVRRQIYPEQGGARYVWRHDYEVVEPDGATWDSPTVRVVVGAPLPRIVDAWRTDSGLEAAPSIREKLGPKYDRVARALNTKCDVRSMRSEFSLRFGDADGYRALWRALPGPAVLFVCAYPRGGQDESNPDIFPVDSALGTDEEFAAVLRSARDANHLIMPYVNPTFWDDQSETAQRLRPRDFAAMYEEGVPHREEYSGHAGYAVSPQAPAVRQRLEQLLRELTDTLPVDFVWQDQVGSRYGVDYGPHVANPVLHVQGWLEHTRRYAHLGLMAEHGHDRMVPYHVGFQGNLLLYEAGGDFGDSEWGSGTWEYLPLVPMMARDKILFYNAPDHYIRTRRGLTWTLAMGQLPSYDIHKSTLNTPWHKTTALLQQVVLSRFAHERVRGYERLGADHTRTDYETFAVEANWSADASRDAGAHAIAPEGFLVQDRTGNTLAGFFSRFEGEELAAGGHCLVLLRGAEEVVVYHPQGTETDLTVRLPEGWTEGPAAVVAETTSSTVPVPFRLQAQRIRFRLAPRIDEREVLRYVVR